MDICTPLLEGTVQQLFAPSLTKQRISVYIYFLSIEVQSTERPIYPTPNSLRMHGNKIKLCLQVNLPICHLMSMHNLAYVWFKSVAIETDTGGTESDYVT